MLDAVARERGRGAGARIADGGSCPPGVRLAAGAAVAGAALGAVGVALAMGGGTGAGARRAPDAPARYAVGCTAAGRVRPRGGRAEPGGTDRAPVVRGLPGDGEAVYEVRCEGARLERERGYVPAPTRAGRPGPCSPPRRAQGEYDRIRVVRRVHGRVTDVLKGRIN